ncbi:MAG: class I SAM-dependent methyltransferase [bacterium]|nr:class I SAM-dependent methyltransferase [bacterium]
MQDSIINLSKYNSDEGVYVLSPISDTFEDVYLKVRQKENRVYADAELILLPFASSSNPHKSEWDLRSKSFQRFREYLKTKKSDLNILDLGCGNGWFCGQLSKSFNQNFYCVDVNLTELIQGRRVFNSEHLRFIYVNIFEAKLPEKGFDIILINAAIQYFPDISKLLNKLLTLLKVNGELHIIDSPIYSVNEAIKAKERTQNYYSSIGFPEMSDKYHHHTWEDIRQFNYKILYNPLTLTNKIKKIFVRDSPFPWIRITR